jgi:hypothetical protein
VAECQWLSPIILATQEAEIRRMVVRSQPRQISSRDPISKIPNTRTHTTHTHIHTYTHTHNKRAGGVQAKKKKQKKKDLGLEIRLKQ